MPAPTRIVVRDIAGADAIIIFPSNLSYDVFNDALAQALEQYADNRAAYQEQEAAATIIGLKTFSKLPSGVVGIYDKVTADFVLSNSIVETAIYTKQIDGGLLGIDGWFRLTIRGKLSAMASTPGTITIKAKYGGSVVTVLNAADLLPAAANEPFRLEVNLSGDGAANVQHLSGEIRQNADVTWLADGAGAEDSTANKNLVVTAQFSVASVDNNFTLKTALLEKLT